MSEARRLRELLETECPTNRRPKHWDDINDPTGPT